MLIQSLQPTIVAQESFLSVMADGAGRLIIKVLDVQGRIAKTLNTLVTAGSQEFPINMEDLPTGKYVLNAFNGDFFLKSFRFVKQ
ncbi:MAG: hypothetical protein ABIX01_12645 [Chitinophagaceae bacterium]